MNWLDGGEALKQPKRPFPFFGIMAP